MVTSLRARWSLRSLLATLTALALSLPAASAWAAPIRPVMQVTGYVINADLDPATNKLSATVTVSVTALEDLSTLTFELNNGLQITRLVDAQQHPLSPERLTTNSTVRIPLAAPLAKGSSTTFTFDYSGVLSGTDTSPVEGIKFAAIADPISILLYPGAWFPLASPGLFTNRFTAEMHIRVPSGERVIGSGGDTFTPKSLPGNITEYS